MATVAARATLGGGKGGAAGGRVEEALAELKSVVLDDSRPVTYKWAARHFGISCDAAKQLMHRLLSATGGKVEAVYCISGSAKADAGLRVVLCTAKGLKRAEDAMSEVFSTHVHSVRPRGGGDVSNVHNTEKEQLVKMVSEMVETHAVTAVGDFGPCKSVLFSSAWRPIMAATRAQAAANDDDVEEPAPQVPATKGAKSSVPKTTAAPKPGPKPQAGAGDREANKKKVQQSAIAGMFANAKARPKQQAPPAQAQKPASNVAAAVSKPATPAVARVKAAVDANLEDSPEKPGARGRKRQLLEDSDDDESSESEAEEEEEEGAGAVEEEEEMEAPPEPVAPPKPQKQVPKKSSGKRRREERVTFDDKGRELVEVVWVDEETGEVASDEAPSPPKKAKTGPKPKQAPPAAKKAPPSKPSAKTAGKAPAPKKGAQKQSGIMGFFGKK
ncbi:unnamed protein product [Pedinophyceae sp. YPF-701]|nr:unnamed protein product [Pedinophyceae sp. YPF-701]